MSVPSIVQENGFSIILTGIFSEDSCIIPMRPKYAISYRKIKNLLRSRNPKRSFNVDINCFYLWHSLFRFHAHSNKPSTTLTVLLIWTWNSPNVKCHHCYYLFFPGYCPCLAITITLRFQSVMLPIVAGSRDTRTWTGNRPRIRRMLYQLRYVPNITHHA